MRPFLQNRSVMIGLVSSAPSLARLPLQASPERSPDRFVPSSAPEFVPPTRAQLLKAVASPFPQGWVGRWVGEMSVTGVPGTDKVGVELDIQPREQGKYSWSLRYQGQPERPYELVPVDPSRGHYLVDEKNGILIDSYYQDGVLTSQFEVGRNRITARYELEGDELKLEMQSFGKEPVRESAHGVKAFPLGSLQRATLRKP